jgi:hypothetical protein
MRLVSLQETPMSAAALGQPDLFAGFEFPVRHRPETRSGPPMGMREIFVPALWSATGLLASIPYLFSLSRILADDSAFGVLNALLR